MPRRHRVASSLRDGGWPARRTGVPRATGRDLPQLVQTKEPEACCRDRRVAPPAAHRTYTADEEIALDYYRPSGWSTRERPTVIELDHGDEVAGWLEVTTKLRSASSRRGSRRAPGDRGDRGRPHLGRSLQPGSHARGVPAGAVSCLGRALLGGVTARCRRCGLDHRLRPSGRAGDSIPCPRIGGVLAEFLQPGRRHRRLDPGPAPVVQLVALHRRGTARRGRGGARLKALNPTGRSATAYSPQQPGKSPGSSMALSPSPFRSAPALAGPVCPTLESAGHPGKPLTG